jgi:tetratricopeptide (TPR) repeat protein
MTTEAEAGGPLVVTLLVNGSREVALGRDEPLFLAVNVVNHAAVLAANRSAVESARHELQDARGRARGGGAPARDAMAKSGAKPVRLGTRHRPWSTLVAFHEVRQGRTGRLRWRIRVLPYPPAPPSVVIDGVHSASAEFGVAPEALQNVRAGLYRVSASLQLGHGQAVFSEAAAVRLLRQKARDPAARVQLARFHYRLGEWDTATSVVAGALERAPSNVDALMLAADIHFARRRYVEALALYERAWQIRRRRQRRGEEPRSLMWKIERTEELAGRRRR